MITYLFLVDESAEGEFGGGEPAPTRPDPDPYVTEPNTTGADHGEQGPVPCGTAAVYVRHYPTTTLLPTYIFNHLNDIHTL